MPKFSLEELGFIWTDQHIIIICGLPLHSPTLIFTRRCKDRITHPHIHLFSHTDCTHTLTSPDIHTLAINTCMVQWPHTHTNIHTHTGTYILTHTHTETHTNNTAYAQSIFLCLTPLLKYWQSTRVLQSAQSWAFFSI